MQRRFYLFLILLFIGLGAGFAANKPVKAAPKKPATLVSDSSNIAVRHFDKAALDRYRARPEFQYQETTVSTSFWTRFRRWVRDRLENILRIRTVKGAPPIGLIYAIMMIIKYAVILICVVGIVFLIFKMIGVNLSFLFRRKSKAVPIPYSESLENIHDINFDSAIEEAISKHNYRLAVRLLYLKCLKQLSDASLIKWQPEKTNNSYLNELADADQKAIFGSLTRRFEYVWYGEFPIDGQTFSRINLQFQEFKSKIA